MPYIDYNSTKPAVKLLIIAFSIITIGIITFFIGVLLARLIFWMHLDHVNDVLFGRFELLSDWQLRYFLAIQTIGFFILPAFFLKWLFSAADNKYIDYATPPGFLNSVFVIIIFICGIPFINYLIEFNEKISLPGFLKGLETNFKETENIYSGLTTRILSVDNAGLLFINILLVAALPAIGEEFIFRGVLQKLFTEISRNIHFSIIITALVFSAIHGQFYGFIPRFLLGMLFGYLMYWSNSIWLPIIAHFINNTIVIAAFYFSASLDFGIFTEKPAALLVLSSAFLIGISTYFIRRTKPLNN